MGIVYDISNDLGKSHNKEEQSDLSFAPTKKKEERWVPFKTFLIPHSHQQNMFC